MQPINRLAVAIPILAAVAAVVIWWGPWRQSDDAQGGRGEVTPETIDERRADLADRVARYAPANSVKLDDLTAPLALTLRALPGVSRVDTPLSPAKPRQRIVHFLDWHFVDRFLLEMLDFRTEWGPSLLEVEAVQLDQAAAFECLARHHGLKRVLIEGLTEADMPALPDKVARLREAEQHQPALKARLAEAKQLVRDFPEDSEKHRKAVALELEIAGMLADHRADMLKMGAGVRLLMSGRLDAVLPLDDAKLLDEADPRMARRDHAAAVARREVAMVKNALAAGPTAVIICGGAHDLAEAIRAEGGDIEYVRVNVRGFLEAAGRGALAGN